MAKLNWGIIDQRFYEAGADRGVLYPISGPGVPWTGLVSVDERSAGGSPQAYYVDGLKYANLAEASEFEATLTALSAPSEFASCDGTTSLGYGLFATEQPRKSFGLSYRTLIGDPGQGLDRGYKIHLIYNALAAPTSRTNATLSDSPEVVNLSWEISTRPGRSEGIKPTAHLVVDSTKADPLLLTLLEAILYGHDGLSPSLPSALDLIRLFSSWSPFSTGVKPTFIGAHPQATTSVTNLALNPSFEATSGTVEVRRNRALSPMPSATAWTAQWGTGGAGTITYSTSGGPGGVGYKQMVWSAPGTGTPRMILTGVATAGIPVVAGETIPLSVDVACSGRAQITWDWYAGETWLSSGAGPTVTPSADIASPTRLTATTGPAPATATRLAIYVAVVPADVVAGTTLRATRLLVGDAGSYFDGSTSPDSDLTPASTGTANASPSILRGAGVADTVAANCAGVSSTSWVKSGARSLRLIPTNAANVDSYANLGGGAGGLRHGMQAGKTYTALATSRLSAPRAGAATVRIMVFHRAGGTGSYTYLSSTPAPNTAGELEHRVTFTLPVGTTEAWVRLTNGVALGGGDVWWDNLALVEGEYTGPYFDGRSRDLLYRKQLASGSWVGTPDASTSKLWFSASLPETANEGDVVILRKDATLNVNSVYVFYGNRWWWHSPLMFDL